MNEQLHSANATSEQLARIEAHVRCRLLGRMRDFALVLRDDGMVLRGHVHTYYIKQLAQHAVREMTETSISANEIEVT